MGEGGVGGLDCGGCGARGGRFRGDGAGEGWRGVGG